MSHLLFKLSEIALAAAQIIDCSSSAGKVELNPVLGQGTFGAEQIARKGAVVGGSITLEQILVRRNRGYERPLTWTNFAVSGATAAIAARNWRQR